MKHSGKDNRLLRLLAQWQRGTCTGVTSNKHQYSEPHSLVCPRHILIKYPGSRHHKIKLFHTALSVRHCGAQPMPEERRATPPETFLCHSSSPSSVYLDSVLLLALLQGKQAKDSWGFSLLFSLGISFRQQWQEACPMKTCLKEGEFHSFRLIDRRLINSGVKKFLSRGTAPGSL